MEAERRPKLSTVQAEGNTSTFLTACPTALFQGRYRWRHDKVLRVLADILEKEKRQERRMKIKGPGFINCFVKSGQKAKGVWLFNALLTKTAVWYFNLLSKVSHPRVLQRGMEGVGFGFININLAVLFWILYSFFKLDFVPFAHTTQQ